MTGKYQVQILELAGALMQCQTPNEAGVVVRDVQRVFEEVRTTQH